MLSSDCLRAQTLPRNICGCAVGVGGGTGGDGGVKEGGGWNGGYWEVNEGVGDGELGRMGVVLSGFATAFSPRLKAWQFAYLRRTQGVSCHYSDRDAAGSFSEQ